MHTFSDHEPDPFPKHSIESYEPAWRAVYETATAKMGELVDMWKGGMDATLIFVGGHSVVALPLETTVR